MADPIRPAALIRVTSVGLPAFQLRRGEEGISVFDPDAVTPALAIEEILASFREGSGFAERSREEIESVGLSIAVVEGAPDLPERLRQAHCEIQPGPNMSRGEFKAALKELE